jgi:hypothetical protein
VVPPPPTAFSQAAADPAAALLDHAALLTVARRAGRRPERAGSPAPAGPDPRPLVSHAAGRRLARILAGDPVPGASGAEGNLLAEWLTAVVVRGLRPPPQFLPALLDRARRVASTNPDPDDAKLRGLVAAAGGPRASWLAGMNPVWSYLLAEPAPAAIAPPEYLGRAAFAEVLGKAMTEMSQSPLTASRIIRLAGRRADPALGAPGVLAEFPPQAPNVLHTMLAVLRFRHDMLKELDDADPRA